MDAILLCRSSADSKGKEMVSSSSFTVTIPEGEKLISSRWRPRRRVEGEGREKGIFLAAREAAKASIIMAVHSGAFIGGRRVNFIILDSGWVFFSMFHTYVFSRSALAFVMGNRAISQTVESKDTSTGRNLRNE